MTRKKIDLIGNRFGRLLVVSEATDRKKGSQISWVCLCDCGNTKNVSGNSLRKGTTQSCGCLRNDRIRAAVSTHGLSNHPLYKVWESMISRCNNPNFKGYKNYGGRGIKVVQSWVESFEQFYNDVSEGYRKGLQLDRKDNNGNYEPSNVRWVTNQQNSMNRGGSTTGSSKYKGVSRRKNDKWLACIAKDGKNYHIGCYETEKDAAIAYNIKAKEFFGEFAHLNTVDEVEN